MARVLAALKSVPGALKSVPGALMAWPVSAKVVGATLAAAVVALGVLTGTGGGPGGNRTTGVAAGNTPFPSPMSGHYPSTTVPKPTTTSSTTSTTKPGAKVTTTTAAPGRPVTTTNPAGAPSSGATPPPASSSSPAQRQNGGPYCRASTTSPPGESPNNVIIYSTSPGQSVTVTLYYPSGASETFPKPDQPESKTDSSGTAKVPITVQRGTSGQTVVVEVNLVMTDECETHFTSSS